MRRLDAYTVYLIMSGASSLFRTTTWVVGAVYYVLAVHMNPLQLVLVGTTLEMSYFLFQIPTGIFADTYSRRTSVVIGTVLVGVTWIWQGLVPVFAAIIGAEIVRGLAEAFIDGAESAWLSDELGEEAFGRAMLRGQQMAQVGGLVGTAGGVALASIRLNLPIVVGGTLILALGVFLALAMPEHGFSSVPRAERRGLHAMTATLRGGIRVVRGTPILLTILAIATVFGAFSEGFDRLWEAHVLRDIHLPSLLVWKPVVWFGAIGMLEGILVIGAAEVVRRRMAPADAAAPTRTLFTVNALLIVGILSFALAPNLAFAIATFCLASVMRSLNGPIYTAWLNRNISDSRVRATVLSMGAQSDALGQFVGGPVIGVVGTLVSLRAALALTGLILSPVLFLYAAVNRGNGAESSAESQLAPLEG